tara:strand:+ start:33645 stop:33830 length:186 start_codon:yes stop_codon:yes gene_type:complete
MNKTKKLIQKALILGVVIVGIYMYWNYAWPTPPAVSGLGFLMAGLAMWVPHCPVMRAIFGE